MLKIADNYLRLGEQIAAEAEAAGRSADEVLLLAVSKTKPVEDMLEAYAAGCRDFGENYVQEIVEKAPELPQDVRLHMIGHLQTNKVAKIVDKVCMIHSVDSLRLLSEIEKQAEKRGVGKIDVLLEVNAAGEESKFGFTMEEAEALLKRLDAGKQEACACEADADAPRTLSGTFSPQCAEHEAKMPDALTGGTQTAQICEAAETAAETEMEPLYFQHVHVAGLMTSAPMTENGEENRPYFRALSALAKRHGLSVLSMGMSGDYQAAVKEGATIVRIGTAIFGARLNRAVLTKMGKQNGRSVRRD